ncbi:hypothetical protein ACA910_013816 [Epithemia clementina (nom. ined.)]
MLEIAPTTMRMTLITTEKGDSCVQLTISKQNFIVTTFIKNLQILLRRYQIFALLPTRNAQSFSRCIFSMQWDFFVCRMRIFLSFFGCFS